MLAKTAGLPEGYRRVFNLRTGNVEVVSPEGVFYFDTPDGGLKPKAGGNLAQLVKAEGEIAGAKGVVTKNPNATSALTDSEAGTLVERNVLEGSANNAAAEIGVPVSRSKNPLSPVLEHDAYGNEIMYRTMSKEQYLQFTESGKLPPTTETSISPSVLYSSKYDGVTVKITVAPGTSDALQEIGIAVNKPAAIQFPNMSTQTGSWMQTNARFKVEGGQMTTQLGQGNAIDILNQNIVDFALVPKGVH